jgi:peptide/nickel transport system permease protein
MLKRLILRRLALALPLLFGISLLTFGIVHLAPGSPVQAQASMNPRISPESVQEMRALYGLDKPLPEQYLAWLSRLARFDLGVSFKDRRPVMQKVLEVLPATLLLSGLGFLIAYGVGIPLGLLTAAKGGGWFDRSSTLASFIAYSLPAFVLALFLQAVLGAWWGIAPISGFSSPWAEQAPLWRLIPDVLWHMLLPITVTAFGSWVATAQFMRNSLIEALHQDYIRTARAKGLSEQRVLWRHALPNALLPLITLLGLQLPGLIGGSFIIESIFAWPGMGRLAYESAINYDYPVVVGVAFMGALLTLAGNLLADIGYALADPRVRY